MGNQNAAETKLAFDKYINSRLDAIAIEKKPIVTEKKPIVTNLQPISNSNLNKYIDRLNGITIEKPPRGAYESCLINLTCIEGKLLIYIIKSLLNEKIALTVH